MCVHGTDIRSSCCILNAACVALDAQAARNCAEVCLCVHNSFNKVDTCSYTWRAAVDVIGILLAFSAAWYAHGFVHPAPGS